MTRRRLAWLIGGIVLAAGAALAAPIIELNNAGIPKPMIQTSGTAFVTNDLMCALNTSQVGVGGPCNALRVQRGCVAIASLAAGALANTCVTWATPYPDTTYKVVASMRDTSAGATVQIAALMLHHTTTLSTTQACAVIFNQDADSARSGEVCFLAMP